MDLRKTQEVVQRAQQLSHFSRRKDAMGSVVLHPMTLDDYPRQYVGVGSLTLTQLDFPRTVESMSHHVHILEMNGSSYRLQDSKRSRKKLNATTNTMPRKERKLGQSQRPRNSTVASTITVRMPLLQKHQA